MSDTHTPPPWCRLYNEVLSDRKIMRISLRTKQPKVVIVGMWATVLAIANMSHQRGILLIGEDLPMTVEDLAAESGLDIDTTQAIMDGFIATGMICLEEETYALCNFSKRNFTSDNSTSRVQKYRHRRKKLGMTSAPGYNSKQIIERDKGRCVYCSSDKNLCVDHIYPIELGGTDDTNNLAAACKQCNSGKSGRSPELAKYVFVNKEAESRYHLYLESINMKPVTVTEKPVTVTVTPPESESESESESEMDLPSEIKEGDRFNPPAPTHEGKNPFRQVCDCWEGHIGVINPVTSDHIKAWLKEHNAEFICRCIEKAKSKATRPIRSPTYVQKVIDSELSSRHPAVAVYCQKARRPQPIPDLSDEIIQTVGADPPNLEFFGKVVVAYVGCGWNPDNIYNILDFYKRRAIPEPNGKANHAKPSTRIRGLQGKVGDSQISKLSNPRTGETYWIDNDTGERVPAPV